MIAAQLPLLADPPPRRVEVEVRDHLWCSELWCGVSIEGMGPSFVVLDYALGVLASWWGLGVPPDVLAACVAACRALEAST